MKNNKDGVKNNFNVLKTNQSKASKGDPSL